MVTTRRFGAYTAGEFHTSAWDRRWRADRSPCGCIWLPGGAGIDLTYVLPDADPIAVNARDLIATLADVGYPILSLNTQWTFGNDVGQTRLAALHAYAVANLGFPNDVILIGGSMGMQTAAVFARNNPTKVRAIAMTVPGTHIDNIHDADRGGFADEINTAWGGNPADSSGWEAAKATHDPISIAADLVDFPIGLWYSTDDPIVLPAEVLAFAAATGAEVHSMGAAGGHSVSTLDADEVLTFLEPYA